MGRMRRCVYEIELDSCACGVPIALTRKYNIYIYGVNVIIVISINQTKMLDGAHIVPVPVLVPLMKQMDISIFQLENGGSHDALVVTECS